MPHYFFHLPRLNKTYLGLVCHKVITYHRDGFVIKMKDECIRLPAVSNPLYFMRGLLEKEYPGFWMINPDLYRPVENPGLPLILCVQPSAEIQLTGFGENANVPELLSAETAHGWQAQPDHVFLERLRQGDSNIVGLSGR